VGPPEALDKYHNVELNVKTKTRCPRRLLFESSTPGFLLAGPPRTNKKYHIVALIVKRIFIKRLIYLKRMFMVCLMVLFSVNVYKAETWVYIVNEWGKSTHIRLSLPDMF